MHTIIMRSKKTRKLCYRKDDSVMCRQEKQPHLHLRSRDSVDSIQPDVMDVGVERTFSPPKFLHVPLATKSEDVGLTVHTISFLDFLPKWL